MPTLRANSNPSSRLDSGDHVIAAAKTVDTKSIKQVLAAFVKVHSAYSNAEKVVRKAAESLQAAEAKVAEADAVQDAAVTKLAAKMIGDGSPKGNPFKEFGLPPPSKLIEVAVAEEAKLTAKLAADVGKRKASSKDTKAVASDLAKAAAAVKNALEPLAALRKAHAAAIAARDAHGVGWARGFARLKVAAQLGEMEGMVGLFSALFGVPAKPKAAKKPVAPAPAPAAT